VRGIERQLARRVSEVTGAVAALLDNGNDTSRFFFDGLAAVLQHPYGVRQVMVTTKCTSTKPAEPALIQQLAAEADFLVAGVAL
jgi:hypothetical protein